MKWYPRMNTKEVCRQLSVTPKMLRVYENQKLINAERSENNYRNYSIDDVLQIQIIVMLRNLGFSLKEIKTVLNLKESKNDYLHHFYIQLKAVEMKVNELNTIKERLNSTINEILSTEDKNEEFLHNIYTSYKTENEKTMYEEILDRWNFDKMAVDYVNRFLKEDIGYLDSINVTAELLLNMVSGKSVIDVGGGTCNLWIDFPKHTRLTVMDKSLQMIFMAKENAPWANYILDDVLLIDKNKFEKYDVVVSTFTLHHIPYEQQEKAIKNIIDLCTEDGNVLILDRSFQNESERIKKEKELADEGNLDYLDIIRSEYYLLADHTKSYIHYLGYKVRTLFFKDQIWGFIINKK